MIIIEIQSHLVQGIIITGEPMHTTLKQWHSAPQGTIISIID